MFLRIGSATRTKREQIQAVLKLTRGGGGILADTMPNAAYLQSWNDQSILITI
jgi:hypothetical protein